MDRQQTGGRSSTLPPVPVGLIAAAGNAQVSLSWTASNVQRSITSSAPRQAAVRTHKFLRHQATSYPTRVHKRERYFYVVSAYNSAAKRKFVGSECNTTAARHRLRRRKLQATAGNARSVYLTASSGQRVITSSAQPQRKRLHANRRLRRPPALRHRLTNGPPTTTSVSALNARRNGNSTKRRLAANSRRT